MKETEFVKKYGFSYKTTTNPNGTFCFECAGFIDSDIPYYQAVCYEKLFDAIISRIEKKEVQNET